MWSQTVPAIISLKEYYIPILPNVVLNRTTFYTHVSDAFICLSPVLCMFYDKDQCAHCAKQPLAEKAKPLPQKRRVLITIYKTVTKHTLASKKPSFRASENIICRACCDKVAWRFTQTMLYCTEKVLIENTVKWFQHGEIKGYCA